MKKIIAGDKEFLLTSAVKFVDVPQYDELTPENVIHTCKLEPNA